MVGKELEVAKPKDEGGLSTRWARLGHIQTEDMPNAAVKNNPNKNKMRAADIGLLMLTLYKAFHSRGRARARVPVRAERVMILSAAESKRQIQEASNVQV